MYSYEIEQLLKLKNYIISNKEYFNFISSPQIKYVKYNPYDNKFYVSTDDNYNFEFKVYKKN